MFRYWPIGPYESADELVSIFEIYRSNPGMLVYVVYDKTSSLKSTVDTDQENEKSESDKNLNMVGTIGFLNADPSNYRIELGHVMTLPKFQGKGVTQQAVRLLVDFSFASSSPPPSPSTLSSQELRPGLGLRRIQWQSDPLNGASVAVAKKAGFKEEGITRWSRVVKVVDGKESLPLPETRHKSENGEEEMGGWNSIVLSICWDDVRI